MELKNFIAGEPIAGSGGRTVTKTNPATGAVLAEVPQSTAADVDRAVAAAKAAFRDWRLTPAPKRGEIMFEVGRRLEERKEELARLMTQEMG